MTSVSGRIRGLILSLINDEFRKDCSIAICNFSCASSAPPNAPTLYSFDASRAYMFIVKCLAIYASFRVALGLTL